MMNLVKQLVEKGIEVGIVIGGGNFWRGRTSETIDRTKADQIGMLATVMNCIYVSEIFRSGIQSIDPGQMEAGRSLGMTYGTVMKDIIIPQAVKNILPALGNELITLFKDTSLVSVIGMSELSKVARDIQAITYLPMMPYLGIAAL